MASRKIVQIATLPGMLLPGEKSEANPTGLPVCQAPVVFALCDDGSLFELAVTGLLGKQPKWVPALPVPPDEPAPTTPVKAALKATKSNVRKLRG